MDKFDLQLDNSVVKETISVIFKKHWKKIKNIEDVDFGKIYQFFQIQHIHRKFAMTDISFLATFTVFEFLHNLNWLISEINIERKKNAINKASGTEICVFKPLSFEYYENQINQLKKGKITVRPEVWNYVFDRLKVSDNEKKKIEKQAADEALNTLKFPVNIIRFIENTIAGNYEFSFNF
jgi:hypothetical protein